MGLGEMGQNPPCSIAVICIMMMRREDKPSKPLQARCTQPQPFNLRLDKKRRREPESRDGYKFYTPRGEKVLRFISERFLAKKQRSGAAAAADGASLQPCTALFCIPKSPKLISKHRTRKVTACSNLGRAGIDWN